MNPREEVLARVRAALADGPTPPLVPRTYRRAGPTDRRTLVDTLAERLTDYRATVHVLTGPADRGEPSGDASPAAESGTTSGAGTTAGARTPAAAGSPETAGSLPATIADLLADATAVAVPADLPAEWLAAYSGPVWRDPGVSDLDTPGVSVLTSCAVAAAETGTIVLDAGPGQGRRALTLVPDRHVCVVPVERIVATVPEALARLADPTRPLTFISGPSATSDIELNRVEGVHGPRRLDVIIAAT